MCCSITSTSAAFFIVAGAIFLVLSLRRPAASKTELMPEQRSEVEGFVERGKKTKAVKRVREVSGASLTEAESLCGRSGKTK